MICKKKKKKKKKVSSLPAQTLVLWGIVGRMNGGGGGERARNNFAILPAHPSPISWDWLFYTKGLVAMLVHSHVNK